jgi:hypothetical protein
MFAEAFAGLATAFGAPFHAGKARWPGVPVYDDGGSIVSPGSPIVKDCTVQVDAATEAMRAAEGYKDTDVRLLVLAASLDGSLDTQATVEVLTGPHAGRYSVQSVERDPAGVAWDCRGRRA